jgi:predicted nucleic acid-binding protein
MDTYMHMSQLDASAAVKLVLSERGSDHLKAYFSNRGGFHITSLCLAEALGVLKRKMLRGEIPEDHYFAKCYFLLAYVQDSRIHIDDIELSSFDTYFKAEELARRHQLDLSDSLQLVSVKHGKFKSFVQESKTVFITADRALATAARKEGLRVWNCEDESQPPAQ